MAEYVRSKGLKESNEVTSTIKKIIGKKMPAIESFIRERQLFKLAKKYYTFQHKPVEVFQVVVVDPTNLTQKLEEKLPYSIG